MSCRSAFHVAVVTCMYGVASVARLAAAAEPSWLMHDPPYLSAQTPASSTPAESTTTGGPASAEELAKKLSNPIASLISVPFQSNFDFNTGQDNDKFKYTLNIQLVIPLSISEDWNLIARIIRPVIYQEELFPGQGNNFGLGDMNPQFFFFPNEPFHGWIWGAGPLFLLSTATDTRLGTGKWAAGPTAVVLRQEGPWTYGLLANHLWSFAGDDDRPDVNQTFLQPFLAYNTKTAFGVTLQTESSSSWEAHQWTVPIGLFASQVLKVGGQPLSLQFGPRAGVPADARAARLPARERLQDLHRLGRWGRVHARLRREGLRHPARASRRLQWSPRIPDGHGWQACANAPAQGRLHRRQGGQASWHSKVHRPAPDPPLR